MTDTSNQAAYAANLAGGLADAGVDIAFVSPGSRNTPLTIALANEPRILDISIRDERSGGFAALGYAKATGLPAVVVCTSGSAAAHYLPAVVEANRSSTPLIVITADRPARLRGTGAPQTMDQIGLYGSHAKEFVDLDTDDPSRGHHDATMLVAGAMSLPGGAVHGNAPFDKPLVPEVPVPPPSHDTAGTLTRPLHTPTDIAHLLQGRKVMIVAGGRGGAALSRAVTKVARTLGAPVFADPQANVSGQNVLAHGDILVSAHDTEGNLIALGSHTPDVVLRLGPIPTSMPMWTWLEHSGVEQILIDRSRFSDPLSSADTVIDADPALALSAMELGEAPDRTFLDAWLAMDATAGAAMDATLPELEFPNEPGIASAIAASVPDHSILFVGSSMPIRDLDAFGVARRTVTVIANRGVNGIDGTISTALGSALTGTATTLYIGDVTALHDVSALAEVQRLGAPLRIVVVNNNGGGIFSFLPQSRSASVPQEMYERHWGTPHGLELATIATAMGLPSTTVSTVEELSDSLSGDIVTPELIEIFTDRSTNPGYHQIIAKAVAMALVGHQQVEKRP